MINKEQPDSFQNIRFFNRLLIAKLHTAGVLEGPRKKTEVREIDIRLS